jgi:hypothetical protein
MPLFKRFARTLAAVSGLALLAAPAAPALQTHHHHDAAGRLHQIRHATARFHNIVTAEAAGYVPFTDVNGVSCIAMPGMGGMGVHLVKPKLIADPRIDKTAPEALVYAPQRDGTLRLAALEYLVDKAAWDAHHSKRPVLFPGHPFDLTKAPSRFGLETFYSQHVWAWKANRAGLLSMWNPAVHCGRA